MVNVAAAGVTARHPDRERGRGAAPQARAVVAPGTTTEEPRVTSAMTAMTGEGYKVNREGTVRAARTRIGRIVTESGDGAVSPCGLPT